ncbi:MAG: GNAT family N-acetyltransferase [Acidimicrobiia bacterium]|nr:GNAT family N-acetyltransferase [Acidimicrobiia bacterium]
MAYRNSCDGVTAEQLEGGFFEGWPNPPSPATHLEILNGSDHVALAFDESTEMVVGFATALSDGVLTAFIPLLEVLDGYRNRGIGSDLVRRVLSSIGDVYAIDLLCDADMEGFYRHLGLTPSFGMSLRNYDRQSGV